MITENITPQGVVEATIEYSDGRPTETYCFKNNILNHGRQALASSIANEIGDAYDFYVARMLFGSNGTSGGAPKFVASSRNALFGTATANKAIVANISETTPNQVSFTSVLSYDDANGTVVNEMALQMNTSDLFSMVTFGDINKTSIMQITWVWRILFV